MKRQTIWLVTLLLLPLAAWGALPKVNNLTCEHLVNPPAVNTTVPRLSWQINGCKRQSAYAIEVSSDSVTLVRGKPTYGNRARCKATAKCWWTMQARHLPSAVSAGGA